MFRPVKILCDFPDPTAARSAALRAVAAHRKAQRMVPHEGGASRPDNKEWSFAAHLQARGVGHCRVVGGRHRGGHVRAHVHDLIAMATNEVRAAADDPDLRSLPVGAVYLTMFLRDARQRDLNGIGTNILCRIIDRSVGPTTGRCTRALSRGKDECVSSGTQHRRARTGR